MALTLPIFCILTDLLLYNISRICVGRHLASPTVWLAIASVLATFNIAKAKDEAGKEIEIEVKYTDGAIRYEHLLLGLEVGFQLTDNRTLQPSATIPMFYNTPICRCTGAHIKHGIHTELSFNSGAAECHRFFIYTVSTYECSLINHKHT